VVVGEWWVVGGTTPIMVGDMVPMGVHVVRILRPC